ncbi:MAG: T9SS type A sorting domain-containing protein, partial [Bacteroidetes bacterium]|nr:T9SS type A sorting domain-containing protein [Bacteroidota bacterium]
PAAGKWVDLTFDMSAGAAKTGLTKIIIFFDPGVDASSNTYYFDDLVAYKAGVCYETFEGGQQLPWAGLDGEYAGAVANPKTNSINSSATVGKYTKSNTHAYSLLLADNGTTPFDLSVNNQFKMKVYTDAPTQVLLKLEGGGKNIEKIQNIAVAGAWQEYTFDFSEAASFTTLTKLIIFFDPGVETSGDTYYFDDICAVPNPCPGVAANPDILDDFECQRHATYAGDWTALSVVNNPAPSGDNNSPKVGRWDDPSGPGTEFSNFQIDYQNPIDLSVRNQFSLKLWAPKAGRLLLKIEGGVSAKEIEFQVTELNQWVEYTADFSGEAGEGHKKLVVFINAFVPGEPGDVYYVDDIKLAPSPVAPPLEDFEGGLHLGWQPLDGNEAVHGTFAVGNNSNPNGVNGSATAGCYTKGPSAFSTLQAISLTNFDLTKFSQFNLDVLSPASGGKVTMVLSGPSGNQQADATVTTPAQWETLKFDFSAFSAVTDFNEVRLLFNGGTAAPGQSWCIDNLRQSETTIDPCADVVPKPQIIDDYECQRNYVTIFYGADDIKPVNNPYLLPANGSLKVGKYTDPAGQPYAGIGIEFAQAPDLTIYNQLQCQVYAAKANVPFLFKLEGGTTGAVEIFDTLKTANTWYQFNVDFSGKVGTDNKKLVIFFDVATDNGGTYYIDNIKWSRKGYNGCIDDHETPLSTITNFTYFNNGALAGTNAEVVDNPLKAGINTSNKVGKLVQAADATIYAGMYADLDANIDFGGKKQMKGKFLMDHLGTVTMKIEVFGNPVPPIEVTMPNTKVNEWEEITFDFKAYVDGDKYNRLTMFPDITSVGTGTARVTYFDDLVIGEGQCGIVGTNAPNIEQLSVSPNPSYDVFRVKNISNVDRFEVYNLLGVRVASINTNGSHQVEIDLARFPAGMYTVSGFNELNQLIGNAKLVKQ